MNIVNSILIKPLSPVLFRYQSISWLLALCVQTHHAALLNTLPFLFRIKHLPHCNVHTRMSKELPGLHDEANGLESQAVNLPG